MNILKPERIVRSNLLESPRVKSSEVGERFAKYLLCESQKNELSTGFLFLDSAARFRRL